MCIGVKEGWWRSWDCSSVVQPLSIPCKARVWSPAQLRRRRKKREKGEGERKRTVQRRGADACEVPRGAPRRCYVCHGVGRQENPVTLTTHDRATLAGKRACTHHSVVENGLHIFLEFQFSYMPDHKCSTHYPFASFSKYLYYSLGHRDRIRFSQLPLRIAFAGWCAFDS